MIEAGSSKGGLDTAQKVEFSGGTLKRPPVTAFQNARIPGGEAIPIDLAETANRL
jgi:hypothetical protein